MKQFRQATKINAPAAAAFAWHERDDAFMRLAPPWEKLELAERHGGLRDGGGLAFCIHKGPIRVKWVAEHYDYIEGKQFCDRAASGPFPHWEHRHIFDDHGDGTCTLRDEVEYRPPLGPITEYLPAALLEDKITAMFAYRAAITREDIERHHAANLGSKRILVAGSSGFVGRRLVPFLTTGGHDVVRLVRPRSASSSREDDTSIQWSPRRGMDAQGIGKLEGVDAVINLAGESVMGLWTDGKRRRIRDSRIDSTRGLCEALAKMDRKPEVLINASAVGIYGNRGDELLTEESATGDGFLADVAREWEAATRPAEEAGIRVVHLRIGLVLGPDGGMLGTMLPAAMAGVTGPLGNGRHAMSWITREDLIYLIHHCIANTSVRGPVNAVAPNPVSNKEFMRTLGRVIHRPTIIPVPAFVLRVAGREFANDILMGSTKVKPAAALASGFRFMLPELEGAIKLILGRAK